MSQFDGLMAQRRSSAIRNSSTLGARAAALLCMSIGLTGCASLSEHSVGLTAEGLFKPCPSAPRCVNSQARSPRHAITAMFLQVPAERAWPAALEELAAQPRTVIVDEREDYVRAEVESPWGVYTDDVELHLRANRIDVRSTARLGYYDFEVNRDRVEALRAALVERDVVRSAGVLPPED